MLYGAGVFTVHYFLLVLSHESKLSLGKNVNQYKPFLYHLILWCGNGRFWLLLRTVRGKLDIVQLLRRLYRVHSWVSCRSIVRTAYRTASDSLVNWCSCSTARCKSWRNPTGMRTVIFDIGGGLLLAIAVFALQFWSINAFVRTHYSNLRISSRVTNRAPHLGHFRRCGFTSSPHSSHPHAQMFASVMVFPKCCRATIVHIRIVQPATHFTTL